MPYCAPYDQRSYRDLRYHDTWGVVPCEVAKASRLFASAYLSAHDLTLYGILAYAPSDLAVVVARLSGTPCHVFEACPQSSTVQD